MTDEDFITTYYNSDDIPNLGRVLQAWYRDRGFEPWRYDGSNITRSSYGDNDETTPVNVAQYVRAVLGFMFALIIYFLILCYVCDRERTVSKQEVDHSIITKRVQPHGDSKLCQDVDDTDSIEGIEAAAEESISRLRWRHCFCGKRKPSVAPAESADDILDRYRSKSHSVCAHCNSCLANETTTIDDELILAEEGGGSMYNDEMMCNICLEPFRVGEMVSWSGLGACQHVFHYDCILPWAVIGHIRCPVCREQYWKRRDIITQPWHALCSHKEENEAVIAMRQSRFCVRHGLVARNRTIVAVQQEGNNVESPPPAAFHISND